jgi:twitching motility protein PilT
MVLAMADEISLLLARLVVERGYVKQADVELCLRAQAQLGGRHHLGALLVHRGLINEEQLKELIALQNAHQQAAGAKAPAAVNPVRVSSPGASGPKPQAHSPSAAHPAPVAAPVAAARAAPVSPAARSGVVTAGAARILGILEAAEKRHASDVHFHPNVPLALRAGGRLLVGNTPPLEARELDGQLRELLTPEQNARFSEEMNLDLLVVTPNGLRCRGALYMTNTGTNAAFRLIRRSAPTLAELGLPASIASFVNYSQGMVLVTGLAGSGKTSTLAALVNLIAEERAEHVLCLEDPVEIIHGVKKALVNQRQVGRDTASFARALRGALREDPDVIVVGDLRDAETISLAVTAAETGHLVLGSMNTATSMRAISRILGAFPPAQQQQVRAMVSESLHGVITQRLIPALDGSRAVALELLMVTPAIGNLIRDDKMFQVRSAMQTGRAQGQKIMDESLRELVLSGRVSSEEAKRAADNPALIPAGPGPAPAGPKPPPAS